MNQICTRLKGFFTHTILIFVSLVFFYSVQAQMCTDPINIVYGMTNAGVIYPINVNTGATGSAINPAYTGNTASSSNAVGYNSLNGNFYYFKRNYGASPQEFVSFSPSTNTYTILASSPVTGNVNSGCVTMDGTGYYCLDQNANLAYYNIAANTWTIITSSFVDNLGNSLTSNFTTYSSGDMAFDALGNLWVVCSGSSKYGLFKIAAPVATTVVAKLTMKTTVPITSMPGTAPNFAGIAFSSTGQIYLTTSTGSNLLYRLETNLTLTYLTTFTVDGAGADLTSCNFPITPLAVKWQDFSAQAQSNSTVALNWGVSDEAGTRGYSVERSSNGTDWTTIGFVAAKGNAQSSEKYDFTDNAPATGKNFYRIADQNTDGTTQYSDIETVQFNSTVGSNISVWPNPAKSTLYIQSGATASNSTYQVMDAFGKMLMASTLKAGQNEINISNLPVGTYFIRTGSASGATQTEKIVKL
jgi:Secretion system C-terminal sorting domain